MVEKPQYENKKRSFFALLASCRLAFAARIFPAVPLSSFVLPESIWLLHALGHVLEGLDGEAHASELVLQLFDIFPTSADEGGDHVRWSIDNGR